MEEFVKLKDITKVYHMGEVEIRAADNINFSIKKGEFVVIVGPSGAGKTTVLNILGGMDTATGGTLTVDGKDITAYDSRQLTGYRRDDIGFVFQFYNLIPNLTALENVELAKLLLCDEPTGALDYNTGKAILKLLQNMCRERGMTVIVITHNQALAPMADRLIHIKNGQVSHMETNENPMSIDEIEW